MRKLVLAIVGSLLLAGHICAQTGQDSWDNLKTLRPGQKIEVVDMKLKSLKGTFVSFSEEAISLCVKDGEVAVQRADVLRVRDREHSKRGRNALLGLGTGLATGLVVGAALDTSEIMGGAQGTMKAGLTPLGGAAGAAIGAAVPSGARTIYRAKKTR